MTDEMIIKALECCGCPYNRCLECPLGDMSKVKCFTELTANALALINRQKAEIERLQTENKLLVKNNISTKYPNHVLCSKGLISTKSLEDYDELIGDISAEAIKEFAERLKENASEIVTGGKYKYKVITTEGIDHLAKEMIGEQQ